MVKKTLDGMVKAIMFIDIVLIFALMCICLLAVLDRYVMHLGLGWTVEIGRLLLIWISFLAAVVATHRKAHFVVDFFVNMFLPSRFRPAWNSLVLLICLGLSVMLTYKGFELCGVMHHNSSSSLDMPMSVFYGSLPVSFALISVMLLVQLVEEFVAMLSPKKID